MKNFWPALVLISILIAAETAGEQPRLRRIRFDRQHRCRSWLIAPSVAIPMSENGSPVSQLFNGRDLDGWTVIEKYDFERHGAITVKDEAIILEAGAPATGVRVAGDFPRLNYEVSLDAKRIEGSDFFCGITFPVGED